MIISKTIIKHPRKQRKCEVCGRIIDENVVRMYGYAETGDKPYVIYTCNTCARFAVDDVEAAQ